MLLPLIQGVKPASSLLQSYTCFVPFQMCRPYSLRVGSHINSFTGLWAWNACVFILQNLMALRPHRSGTSKSPTNTHTLVTTQHIKVCVVLWWVGPCHHPGKWMRSVCCTQNTLIVTSDNMLKGLNRKGARPVRDSGKQEADSHFDYCC